MAYPSINRSLRFTTPRGELEIVEKEIPPIPANELLVKVKAASINPVDIQLWGAGLVAVVAGDKGMGRDFSGTVVSVGSAVKGWAVGDDIFGLLFHIVRSFKRSGGPSLTYPKFGQGTFSQYINVNPASDPVAKKPGCLTHQQAASIPLVALTAFACLAWLPPPATAQRRVIIIGASGGTGSWLVQLAKVSYDCHVTAVCSSRNAEYVKKLGADEVIDYTTKDVTQTLLAQRAENGESDLIVDCVGGKDLISHYEHILHPKGAYVTIVGDKTNVKSLGGPITYLTNPVQILRYIKGYIWGPRYACIGLLSKSSYLEQIVGRTERGEIHAEVQEVVKGAMDGEIQGWRKAIELIESKRIRGKVVLEIP
ncbi:Reticulon-4-interacting [Hyphodiscus hymeniophilus]|uniref:Reticulon-4-interacting n=1 Tax=Hyphodiscus hymeniophilus TaxID=353542 RepID=A0A9P7AZM0_9HELO|nr:Reticulon-4-interacting [Hyphodiscus hymeniophilus]